MKDGLAAAIPNRNTMLKFCVVNDVTFRRLKNKGFAVLSLTKHNSVSNLPYGVTRVTRYFDDEDTSNDSKAYIDGVEWHGQYAGDCWIGWDNTKLAFLNYRKDVYSAYSSMPSIDISYGVLGGASEYSTWGEITTADEKTRNANWLYIDEFDDDTHTYRSDYFENLVQNSKSDYFGAYKVDDILQPLSSTTNLHLAKIK